MTIDNPVPVSFLLVVGKRMRSKPDSKQHLTLRLFGGGRF
jgi:hypothetical protein